MIPIIFDKSEPNKGSRAFASNGLGRLSDAISCSVTKSLDGGQYDLSMEYPVDGVFYDNLVEKNYIVASVSHKSNPQPFRISKISKPINGRVSITANHISYILKKTLIRPYMGTSEMEPGTRLRIYQGESLQTTLSKLNNYIQPEKNRKFTFVSNITSPVAGSAFDPYTETWYMKNGWGNGYDSSTETYYWEIKKPLTVQDFLTGTDEDSISGIFGVKEEDNTQFELTFDGMTVDVEHYVGTDTDIQIRYGKQMTDMTYETDHEESYEYAVPYYSGSRTATTIIGAVAPSGHVDTDDSFGEITMVDLSSDETYGSYLDNQNPTQIPTPENADSWVKEKMSRDEVWLSKENVNVSFIDLWKTEEYKDVAPLQLLDIGDSVTVVYPDLGVNVTKRIQNENWDSLVDRYTSMTLGDLRERDLKDVIVEDIEQWMGKTEEYIAETNEYFSTEIARTSQEIIAQATRISGDEESIAKLQITADEIVQEVWDSSEIGGKSRLDMMPTSIDLSVSNNYSSAGITISVKNEDGEEIDSDSGTIQMNGVVTFSSLASSGSTVINGDNITTGQISASRINVDDLVVKKLITNDAYNTEESSNIKSRVEIENGEIRIYGNNTRAATIYSFDNGSFVSYFKIKTQYSGYLETNSGWYIKGYAINLTTTNKAYYNGNEIATKNDIPSLSGYATTTELNSVSSTAQNALNAANSKISGVTTNNGSSQNTYSSNTHVYTTGLKEQTNTTTVTTNRNSMNLSDARLKENIVDLRDFTKVYMRLRPVEFNYKWYNLPYTNGLTQFGIIAQELQQICEEEGILLYHTTLLDPQKPEEGSNEDFYVGKDGRVLTVDKENLHALHIQMIQKQQREIESLKQETISLRGELEILKQQLKEIIG